MKTVVTISLVATAAIHLLPSLGVLSAQRVQSLYGILPADPNLEILLRHRAVLFGLLGALLLYAAFNVELQPLAFGGGFISVATFLGLATGVGGYNAQLSKVVAADVAAMVLLFVGGVTALAIKDTP